MDLFREIEKTLRSYTEHLPIDDFLPAEEKIPSALPEEFPVPHPSPEKLPRLPGPMENSPPEEGKPRIADPGRPREPVSGNVDQEIREFLEQQKARGRHDPSEWAQEGESPSPPTDPSGPGSGPSSDS